MFKIIHERNNQFNHFVSYVRIRMSAVCTLTHKNSCFNKAHQRVSVMFIYVSCGKWIPSRLMRLSWNSFFREKLWQTIDMLHCKFVHIFQTYLVVIRTNDWFFFWSFSRCKWERHNNKTNAIKRTEREVQWSKKLDSVIRLSFWGSQKVFYYIN